MRKFMSAEPDDGAVTSFGAQGIPAGKTVESKSQPHSIDITVNPSEGENWGRHGGKTMSDQPGNTVK